MATKKPNPAAIKLQELRDRVAELESQKEEIERQLREAQTARWTLEREIRRSEKPTPAMVAVLSALLDGGTLTCYEYNHPCKYQLGVKNKDNHLDHRTISSQTFYGLSSREAIQEKGREGVWSRVYEITEHGRAIAVAHIKGGASD